MIRHPFVPSDMVIGNLLDDTTEPSCNRCSYGLSDPRHTVEVANRLYNIPPSDQWYASIRDAINEYMDYRDGPKYDFKVDEYTVVDPIEHLRDVDGIIRDAVEWAGDNGEIDEILYAQLNEAAKLPHVIEAFDKALRVLAGSTTYRMADELNATHVVEVHRHPGGGWSWTLTGAS